VKPLPKTNRGQKNCCKKGVEVLAELQDVLYAQDEWLILLIFQAKDAAGKDGVIKHVMSGVNPQGCQVFSFKSSSAEDLNHVWVVHGISIRYFEQNEQRADESRAKLIHFARIFTAALLSWKLDWPGYSHLRHDENLCCPSLESCGVGPWRRLWRHRH
jgi:polyphosphate kinase 2 PPK2